MVTCVLCCADLVFWSMPYGQSMAPRDELLTDVDVEQFFQQVAIINRARHHTMGLSSTPKDTGRMAAFMAQTGNTDIHPLFAFKRQQNTAGMHWVLAVEQMIFGFKGASALGR